MVQLFPDDTIIYTEYLKNQKPIRTIKQFQQRWKNAKSMSGKFFYRHQKAFRKCNRKDLQSARATKTLEY